MIDENVRWNILVATRALWVGADGHSTGAGVGRSWKVTELDTNLKARLLGAPDCDGFDVPGKPVNRATDSPGWRPFLCDSPPVY